MILRLKPNERNFISCESRIFGTHSLRLNSFCVVVWYKLHFYMKPNAAKITRHKFRINKITLVLLHPYTSNYLKNFQVFLRCVRLSIILEISRKSSFVRSSADQRLQKSTWFEIENNINRPVSITSLHKGFFFAKEAIAWPRHVRLFPLVSTGIFRPAASSCHNKGIGRYFILTKWEKIHTFSNKLNISKNLISMF
jgi:hypothetical protein